MSGQVVGTLHGGGASCSTPSQPDWYGRFDQAYTALGMDRSLAPANGTPAPVPRPTPTTGGMTAVQLSSGQAVSGGVAHGVTDLY